MFKNDEGVLQRLETLRRRSVSLKSVVRQLVVEIEEESKNCDDVDSGRKDVLRVQLRRLFDANVRLRNLARNYKRKKNLQRKVSTDETSDPAGLVEVERCGDDSEFDPSTVVVGQHEPPIFLAIPLPHSKALRPIIWNVGWPLALQRRHHIDGQFADADFKAESWVCSSPTCKNIFYPRQTQEDIREFLDLKCWSCSYKAFCEVESAMEEPILPTEMKDGPSRAKDDEQEPVGKVCDEEDVLHSDDSPRKDETKTSRSYRELDWDKASPLQARVVPRSSLKAEDEPDAAFTKIKPLPLKSNNSYMKKETLKKGQLDINSNIAKKRGGFEKDVEVVKSEDLKPFSTRPVCTCPHPCSSSKPSKGTCPLHPTTQSIFLHASKPPPAVSQKELSLRVRLRQQKSQTSSGFSLRCKSSSADSTSTFPGCTCPSFHSKIKEEGSTCKVHPNLHHLRQPSLPDNFGRRRIEK